MNYALILAGGTGSRIGGNIPKQFIEVMGKPILAYTLDIYQDNTAIDAIEIVCHKDWLDETRRIVDTYGYSKVMCMVPGGETFQKSVICGVNALKGIAAADDIVVVGFGVSPMTSEDIILDSIRVCTEHGNGISAEDQPLCTCIKDDEYGSSTGLIRETIKGFSTPWSFRFGELCKAYEEAERQGILDGLEPHTTSVYFALGKRIWFSKSNGHNFKITTKEDLDRFEGLLLLKEKRRRERICLSRENENRIGNASKKGEENEKSQ